MLGKLSIAGAVAAILTFATGSIAILSDPDFVARYLPAS